MIINCEFKDDVHRNIILLDGKRYSDTGMMLGELSNITGIDIDTLSMYDDWYILDDGFYYFKFHFIFQELFMSELAKEYELRCVEFKLAKVNRMRYNSTLGIISKLYRDKEKEYYFYSEFCKRYFGEYINDLNKFRLLCENRFGDDKTNKLVDDIYSMICFDMFTGQHDRGEHNFMFEYNSDDVRLAPLCDNGWVFNYGYDYDSPFGNFCLFETDMYTTYRKSLIDFLRCEKMLYDRFEHILDIDVKEVLRRTLDKYMIVMDIGNRKRILRYMDGKKKAIDATLNFSKR